MITLSAPLQDTCFQSVHAAFDGGWVCGHYCNTVGDCPLDTPHGLVSANDTVCVGSSVTSCAIRCSGDADCGKLGLCVTDVQPNICVFKGPDDEPDQKLPWPQDCESCYAKNK